MSWFERTLQVSGYPIKKAEQDYLRQMALPADQRINWIQNQRKAIVRHHLENSVFYQSLVQKHQSDKDPQSAKALEALVLNGPESLSSDELELLWSRLPIMTKNDLQRPLSERYALGYGPKNTHKHKTSGSSGHPFVFVKDRYAHAYSWAEIKQLYLGWGIALGVDLEARFYGIPLRGLARQKERLKDKLARRQRMVIFDLSDTKLEAMLKRFKRYPFGYLNGYTSSIVRFGQFLAQKSIVLKDICPSLKACIVTSEMLFPEDKTLLEKVLGVPVINEYGASELGVIAMADPSGALVVNHSSVYLELVDDFGQVVAPGATGRVVLTAPRFVAIMLLRNLPGILSHF